MSGITVAMLRDNRPKQSSGGFEHFLDEPFYKISRYDALPAFFMTIVSSSDIWNYIWSNGGLTAGRIDCDHAVFPYYTADKVSDNRNNTGSYTAVKVYTGDDILFWEPFQEAQRGLWKIERNLYKNTSGSKLYFEEINNDLELTFQYGWTSSDTFGLVRHSRILNTGPKEVKISILDGCRNILPACVTSSLQNDNSVLLDAYKKTDLDSDADIALFSVTSIVTDKAEPSEGLFANVSWFSTNKDEGTVHLSPSTPDAFRFDEPLPADTVVKGERPAFYLHRELKFSASASDEWYQVFDTSLDLTAIVNLKHKIADRSKAAADLKKDITAGVERLDRFIAEADGMQQTADVTACVHHKANVMFNIMRGGFFINNNEIDSEDFLSFIIARNRKLFSKFEKTAGGLPPKILYPELHSIIISANDPQLERLFLEYMPLSFSRRHGDPSRPWNRFSIEIKDKSGNPRLNYQGNWRDIFQNWEALGISYPAFIPGMIAKFLNACTADGFNPYRITRQGIDWEVQEPENPWSNIGYWGDHQIIYLAKLMEWQSRFNRQYFEETLNRELYSSGNVPYRLKSYADIIKDPRSTIIFDSALHSKIEEEQQSVGSDAKLTRDKNGDVVLVTMTEKLLVLVLAKMANYIPSGGIWLNTQRPEWNDANNALAGYGLSMVTLYYLRRFLVFLKDLYAQSSCEKFTLTSECADFFTGICALFTGQTPAAIDTPVKRRSFVDSAGLAFEKMREQIYSNGFCGNKTSVSRVELINGLSSFLVHLEHTIRVNKRADGLYHSYNTMSVAGNGGIELHYLYEMLEGQVAVLSSEILDENEVLQLCRCLKAGPLFRHDQYSYILYPDRELPHFAKRNIVPQEQIKAIPLLSAMCASGDTSLVHIDRDGDGHFNPEFRNVRDVKQEIAHLKKTGSYDSDAIDQSSSAVYELYEKTFNHQSFTGRSGTFYAYEGLGSIYWHMVTKLLLAVQENALLAKDKKIKEALIEVYYDVRKGIGFNKTPENYGAFPTDPYSHTPAGQGAKQPGMTGQVKEEVITRWGELGLHISAGRLSIQPELLLENEVFADGHLSFTWCGVPFFYYAASGLKKRVATRITVTGFINGKDQSVTREGNTLSSDESRLIFMRGGAIKKVEVYIE